MPVTFSQMSHPLFEFRRQSLIAFAIVFVLAATLVGCGSPDPDCNAAATQDSVVRIVSEHQGNKFVAGVASKSKLLESVRTRVRAYFSKHGFICEKCDERNSLFQEQQQALETVKKAAVFKLANVRTSATDPGTKAVSCTATLNFRVEDNSAEKEINYEVEKGADGKMRVVVLHF
jgi:hypothetical protein